MTLTNWNPELGNGGSNMSRWVNKEQVRSEWKEIPLDKNQIGEKCWTVNWSAVFQVRIIKDKDWYYVQQLNLENGMWNQIYKTSWLDRAQDWAYDAYKTDSEARRFTTR